jgi:hypothetical protein
VTDFSKKCEILGDLYSNYREDPEFKDFAEFNDLGLPLAYLSHEGLCELSTDGERYIEETWNLFVDSLGIEDVGFESLDEMLQAAIEQN